MAKKKIAIVGAGAVGGYAGAHMVQAGEDVTYIDPWPENVEAIRKRRAARSPISAMSSRSPSSRARCI